MGKINTDNYPNRPFSSYQDDDMFVLQDNGGETYTTNVGDVKNLADSRIKLEGVQVNGSDLPISNKKVNVDISGKTDLSVIAYTFNSEMGYLKGAYVTYNGKLYEFIQEHTGAWNPSHVREIRASGQYVRTGNGGYNNGDRATCEGYMTKASGNYSHAEGRETQAVGECTHAEGRETIANSIYQHVEGKYNIADNESKYIHIIGNGTDDNNRSNAMTLDWNGNLAVSGEVEDGNGEKISDKTDKVTNATSGHLAGLDSNGNLTDSGVSPTEDVTVEGNPVTFVSPFEQDAKSVVVSVKPIQSGSGTPSPENIRPISGIDEVEIGVTGKNLCGNWKDNTVIIYTDGSFYPQNGYKTCDFIRVSQGQKIYIQSNNIGGEKWWYTKDKTPYMWAGNGVGVKTSPIDGYFAMSVLDANASTTMVEYGESGSEYEPYKGSTTTIDLGQTVYGGTVDFESGVVTVDKGFVTFDGSEDEVWDRYTSGSASAFAMQIQIPDFSSDHQDIVTTNYLQKISANVTWGDYDSWISAYGTGHRIMTGIKSITTVEAWKAYLAEHPLQVCYELATPTTLSFDPADVELLEGTNVVTTNGEKVAVTYGRSLWQDIDDLKTDTEGKLDKSDVADVEGDTASKAYSVNDFMLRADGLYKVTQPIAQNASITASNTTKTTIGAVLTALLNA